MGHPTKEQIILLSAFMKKHPDLARALTAPSGSGRATQRQNWEKLVRILNSNGPPSKTVAEWKRIWTLRKYNLKKKLKLNKASLNKTGGDPIDVKVLNATEEAIVAACGMEISAITEGHEQIFQNATSDQIDITASESSEATTTEANNDPNKFDIFQQKYKRKVTKSRSNSEERDPMLNKSFKILEDSSLTYRDPYFTYGQHIANELRKYTPRTLTFVKQAINNIIFEADFGKYNNLDYVMPSPQLSMPKPLTSAPYPQQSTTSLMHNSNIESEVKEEECGSPDIKPFTT